MRIYLLPVLLLRKHDAPDIMTLFISKNITQFESSS